MVFKKNINSTKKGRSKNEKKVNKLNVYDETIHIAVSKKQKEAMIELSRLKDRSVTSTFRMIINEQIEMYGLGKGSE